MNSTTSARARRKGRNGFDLVAINWVRDRKLPSAKILRSLSSRACRRGTIKSVLLALATRASAPDHSTFVGVNRLARDTGYDRGTVIAALDVLDKLELIRREPSSGRRTLTVFLLVDRLHSAADVGCITQPMTGCINPLEVPTTETCKHVSSVSSEVPGEGAPTPRSAEQKQGRGRKDEEEDHSAAHAAYQVGCREKLNYVAPPNVAPQLEPFFSAIKHTLGELGSDGSVSDVVGHLIDRWQEFSSPFRREPLYWKFRGKGAPLPADLDADAAALVVQHYITHRRHEELILDLEQT